MCDLNPFQAAGVGLLIAVGTAIASHLMFRGRDARDVSVADEADDNDDSSNGRVFSSSARVGDVGRGAGAGSGAGFDSGGGRRGGGGGVTWDIKVPPRAREDEGDGGARRGETSQGVDGDQPGVQEESVDGSANTANENGEESNEALLQG